MNLLVLLYLNSNVIDVAETSTSHTFCVIYNKELNESYRTSPFIIKYINHIIILGNTTLGPFVFLSVSLLQFYDYFYALWLKHGVFRVRLISSRYYYLDDVSPQRDC